MRKTVALFLAAAGTASSAPPPTPVPVQRPRLVVFVSVDQMRQDYLTRFAPLFQGGFRRLLAEGAVFPNAYYRHADTETGPGHSLLLTGRHARDTGIVANEWYDRLRGGMVNVVDDGVSRPLPGPGRGASPANSLGVTIGDLLKGTTPGARVVGVSVKDRSAILLAGRRADAAYWLEARTGGFATSTYYTAALPPWLQAWRDGRPFDRLRGASWERLLPDAALYEKLAGPDAVKGEHDTPSATFPHALRGAPPDDKFFDDVRHTPYGDEIVLEAALLAMKAHDLGRDDATDVLAVGFSATDAIGHWYGPDSQEVMDQLLRLDRTLGRLMEAAEEQAGRGRVLFGLSADHGSMPLAEVLQARGTPARRVHPDVLRAAVKDALARRFPGAQGLVAADDVPNFYLDEGALRRAGLAAAEVAQVIGEALVATGVVERVYTPAELLGPAPAGDPDFAFFRNAFFEPRSPQVIARLKRWVDLESDPVGTGHGTVQDYDRHVPVAFLGPGIRAGRFEAPCGPEDIAPTLSALLGLPYRLEEGQRVLSEALENALVPLTPAPVSAPGHR